MQSLCEQAGAVRHEARQAEAAHAEARRTLAVALTALEAAREAVDHRRRLAEKAHLKEVYRGALAVAATQEARASAAADWARGVDRINRAARRARGTLAAAMVDASQAEATAQETASAMRSARIRAESAEVACLEARSRLAVCEEAETSQAGRVPAAPDEPVPRAGAPDGSPSTVPGHPLAPIPPQGSPSQRILVGQGGRLVMEAILWGDRAALIEAAAEIAERTGGQARSVTLQVKALADALSACATARGYISVDHQHPFWSRLSEEEARDIMRAFADMGFRVEPGVGWLGGRAPVSKDLSVALAYAGIDPRTIRHMLPSEELATLPDRVSVDVVAMLAAEVPDLSLERLVALLEERSLPLSELWDAWGQIRPVLLAQTARFPAGDG